MISLEDLDRDGERYVDGCAYLAFNYGVSTFVELAMRSEEEAVLQMRALTRAARFLWLPWKRDEFTIIDAFGVRSTINPSMVYGARVFTVAQAIANRRFNKMVEERAVNGDSQVGIHHKFSSEAPLKH